MTPRKAIRRLVPKTAALQPGKIICRANATNSFADLFAVVGTSYTELAMVRLFEEKDLNNVLKHKCSYLIEKLSFSAPFENAALPLYADVTILLYQNKETILRCLADSTYRLVGKVNKKDLAQLALVILKCSTISLHEKTTFFTF